MKVSSQLAAKVYRVSPFAHVQTYRDGSFSSYLFVITLSEVCFKLVA